MRIGTTTNLLFMDGGRENAIEIERGRDLTGIRLWAQICAHLNLELRECLITFPIFVPSQRLIARNIRELFSFNRGVSHLNNACCIA
jgi:hypothetical protein